VVFGIDYTTIDPDNVPASILRQLAGKPPPFSALKKTVHLAARDRRFTVVILSLGAEWLSQIPA
jgi:hypothetical protein